MKRLSMFKLDYWLLHGYGGLNNMLEQRLTLETGIQEKVVQKAIEELNKFTALMTKAETKACKNPVDTEAELLNVDTWMVRGLNGMINMLESRVVQISEPMFPGTIIKLEYEIGRLTALTNQLKSMQ